MSSIGFKMRGEARVRLIDEAILEKIRRENPGVTRDELLNAYMNHVAVDTGWNSNTITDYTRQNVAAGAAFGSSLNIFIHGGSTPANAQVNTLQYLYTSQSPNQVRAPDSTTLDASTLVQTRTVEYTAPSVARTIRIVGLTFGGTVSASNNYLTAIAAYTVLSSAIIQSTSQVADVQYRVTFSIET